MENFGQVIKRRRRELGLTQREVAERIRFEDGRTISGPYLVELEHSTRSANGCATARNPRRWKFSNPS
jgi:transcriptional regulator with XRE-family HTH domain